MKKYTVLSAALCVAVAFTGCKSNESAYKKAYEKAKSQEAAQQVVEETPEVVEQVPVVAPVVTKPATETKVVDNVDNVSVRQEKVSLINGSGLKNFSVVVGSFGLRANAEGLQQQLRANGYDAQVVKNDANNMFRVVSATFDSKADAVQSRDKIRGTKFNPNSDAWLLYNVQ